MLARIQFREGGVLIDAQGWIEHPEFIRIDGIADKVYSQPNNGQGGLACHSIVGEEPDADDGVPNRFLSRERMTDGNYTPYAAASCMFILRKRAPHIQMYPVTASTWTTGGREANTTTWAIEAEGGRPGHESEPLTRHQEDGFLAIATAWEARLGRRLVVGQTVRSHGEIARRYGYAATACESGRFRNAWARLAAGERYGAGAMLIRVEQQASDEMIRRIVRDEVAGALDIDNALDVRLMHFRKLLDLAVNGGQGQFADAYGNALPLVRDGDLLERVEMLEAALSLQRSRAAHP